MISEWHDTRIVVVVSPSFSRLGRHTGGMTEAQCSCGWVKSCSSLEKAERTADEHKNEMNGEADADQRHP